MTSELLPPFIKSLLQPEAYPHRADEIRLIQTHISYVLLAGEFVYKIKKPLDFGFLNFATLEKRKYFCEQELLLNRRLCPDIYLEVVPVVGIGGTHRLGHDGEPVEFAVKMARLPEERMMYRVIARGELRSSHLDRIIDILEPFYAKAEGGAAIRSFGTAAAVGRIILENLEQIEPFVGGRALSRQTFGVIASYTRDFLGQKALFEQRIEAGCVRDCHGDLYSANICLADKVHIFDCIEFNERYRYGDLASDVAFLAMDLDFNGLRDLSAYFIERFIRDTGDKTLDRMLRFYKCYRAMVRGKVGLLTAREPEVDEGAREEALTRAGRYFALAREYAAGQP